MPEIKHASPHDIIIIITCTSCTNHYVCLFTLQQLNLMAVSFNYLLVKHQIKLLEP